MPINSETPQINRIIPVNTLFAAISDKIVATILE